MKLADLVDDEQARLRAFPVAGQRIFMAHAGVSALPACVADAMCDYVRASAENAQEFDAVLRVFEETRAAAARAIGASADEIALLGPTSLGLSLFAQGLNWQKGDEVLCYADDYPANVYPWMDLERLGVKVRYLKPERRGEITPGLVAESLTPATRLVALASCHFLTGYRIDVDAIGRMLRKQGVLFSLDAIQTIGAFRTSVEHVDFLSADAHKWMLGPMAIGIVYVRREHWDRLRPVLLGAWNVDSPGFVTQDRIEFHPTARRYEPGVLNAAGIYGMRAALDLVEAVGQDAVSSRILELKSIAVRGLRELGFEIEGPTEGAAASGITTFTHPSASMPRCYAALENAGIAASSRQDREGVRYIRFSPHFYNTGEELQKALRVLGQALEGQSAAPA